MRRQPLAAFLACALLAACDSGTQTVQNNAQPAETAVVEGTIDDRMTDLDAAQVDGLPPPASNAAGPAARRAPRDRETEVDPNAEAVAAE